MKKIIYSVFLLLLILSCAHRKPVDKAKTKELLVQAYTFGFPLVLMDMTREVETNVSTPDPQTGKAPANQFVHHQSDSNQDLQLSTAWLDLSQGPQVLDLPDTEGRFYFMPMMDAWTNVFMSPGKRTSGPEPKKFVIVGPKWDGDIPPGTEFIRSKTEFMWIIGRTQSSGKKDLEAVQKLQNEYKLYPLENLGKTYTPPEVAMDPNLDMQPALEKIFNTSGDVFFTRLNALMRNNPPSGEDFILMKRLAKLDIGPGKVFKLKDFDKKDQAFIKQLPMLMKEQFEKEKQQFLADHVGWHTVRDVGAYGTDYTKRAVLSYIGFGTNQDEDALYPFISRDVEGNKFVSEKRYVLHFEPDEVPQTNAFFTLSTFRPDAAVLNDRAAYSTVSMNQDIKFNSDRSLDIYIQSESPGPEKEANWVRSPQGEFLIGAQLFWPKMDNITDSWTLPPVYEAGAKVKLTENLTENATEE